MHEYTSKAPVPGTQPPASRGRRAPPVLSGSPSVQQEVTSSAIPPAARSASPSQRMIDEESWRNTRNASDDWDAEFGDDHAQQRGGGTISGGARRPVPVGNAETAPAEPLVSGSAIPPRTYRCVFMHAYCIFICRLHFYFFIYIFLVVCCGWVWMVCTCENA